MATLLALVKKVWCIKKYLILIGTPLLLLPILFALPPKEGKCLYVVLLMAVFWCTEALPLAVTALLPIILFPFLGILPSNKVCPQYFLDTNFLFLSGLIMAAVVEEWNLHRRIALKVLMIVGVQPARLILGMMLTTAFLSMWLSNTASTAMMLPIASAILKSLYGDDEKDTEMSRSSEENFATGKEGGLPCTLNETQRLSVDVDKDIMERMEVMVENPADSQKEKSYRNKIWKGFLICIPYSASIGGTATLTGTAPNLILLGQLKSYFPGCDVVNFGSWFLFAFPLMLLFLFFGWLWISILYGAVRIRCSRKKKSELRSEAENKALAIIQEDYRKLGPIKFAEQAVFVFFCLFAILLFTRDPKFIPGWAILFKPGFTSDAVTGISVVIILFFFPSKKPSLRWWFDLKGSDIVMFGMVGMIVRTLFGEIGFNITMSILETPNNENQPLLSWKKTQDTVPWNIILLLGGGFAMAKGCEESGLSTWIGSRLQPLDDLPAPAAVLLVTILIASFTEFASNTATIIVFLPVLAELAIRLRVNPLYLMIPGTVGCSYAFMLPVSTPPNSIAFSTGHLMVKDMARTGLVMNLMGVLLLSLAMNTWALSIFQLNTIPDWVHLLPVNSTLQTSGVENYTANPFNRTI